tara:strand:- start:1620 stop:1808 length:189 start_codon:yes stop_codon:yes gene_type:complete
MHAILVAYDGWSVEEANELLSADPLEIMMRSNAWTCARLGALGTPWQRFTKLVEFHGWVPKN